MSTQDGSFADGPAGQVRIADFDALDDDAESVDAPVRVASFDTDDATDVPAGVRTVDLDDEANATPSDAPRVATFDEPEADGRDDSVRTAGDGWFADAGQAPADEVAGTRGRGRRDRRSADPAGETRRREPGDAGSGRARSRGGADRRDRESVGAEESVRPDEAPEGGGAGRVAGETGTGRDARGSRSGRRGRTGKRAETGPPLDDEARAKEICLRLLTDRARTVKELRDALHRKEIPDDVADRVLERFDEVGLVDDEAFAGQWVRSRHNHRGLGRRAIAMELHRKGVARDVADEALSEIDAESEEAKARELVARKIRTVKVGTRDERSAASRRLVGMLARKGYGAGVAYTVVREAIAARGAEEDELGEEPADD